MTVFVWTTVGLPGFHRWPDAAGARAYLSFRHRHLFVLTVEVRIDGSNDRPVEFHDLQAVVRTWWGPKPREWGDASCEAIAGLLGKHLHDCGFTVRKVTVSEDGESGATEEFITT